MEEEINLKLYATYSSSYNISIFFTELSDWEKEFIIDLRKLSNSDRKAVEQIVSQLAKNK